MYRISTPFVVKVFIHLNRFLFRNKQELTKIFSTYEIFENYFLIRESFLTDSEIYFFNLFILKFECFYNRGFVKHFKLQSCSIKMYFSISFNNLFILFYLFSKI